MSTERKLRLTGAYLIGAVTCLAVAGAVLVWALSRSGPVEPGNGPSVPVTETPYITLCWDENGNQYPVEPAHSPAAGELCRELTEDEAEQYR